ncbi:MAG: hypothetical protein QW038_01685 [Nanopusillaceae archaeon]
MTLINQINQLKEKSEKRRFKQTYELIINLKKEYDLNKTENRILDYFELPNGKGKKDPICVIVGNELEKIAKGVFDYVITKDKLPEIANNKRLAKKIARKYYIFASQMSVMPDVGKYLGRYLGARDKMPNPKFGMIFPDNFSEEQLKNLYNKLQKMVRVSIKKHLTFGIPVGNEDMEIDKVNENILAFLDWLYKRLPGGKTMIKSVYLKLTMSKSIKLL